MAAPTHVRGTRTCFAWVGGLQPGRKLSQSTMATHLVYFSSHIRPLASEVSGSSRNLGASSGAISTRARDVDSFSPSSGLSSETGVNGLPFCACESPRHSGSYREEPPARVRWPGVFRDQGRWSTVGNDITCIPSRGSRTCG